MAFPPLRKTSTPTRVACCWAVTTMPFFAATGAGEAARLAALARMTMKTSERTKADGMNAPGGRRGRAAVLILQYASDSFPCLQATASTGTHMAHDLTEDNNPTTNP